MTAEEVWGTPDGWLYACYMQYQPKLECGKKLPPVIRMSLTRWDNIRKPWTETPLYTRAAMEAYAAEKVAEALAAEPTEAMVKAGRTALADWLATDPGLRERPCVRSLYRAMQAANQHHGGNDADT